VISEARIDDIRQSYAELTNVGTTTLNLASFEFGIIGAWTAVTVGATNWTFNAGVNYYFMLPDRDLAPGESFVIAAVQDWNPEHYFKNPEKYSRVLNKKEFWTLADIKCDFPEAPFADPTDSVTPYYHVMETWSGRDCLYLRYHISETDSVIVDQVNGIFTGTDHKRPSGSPVDVAGFTNATNEATLVRKFNVKQGNINFVAGIDLSESEWMPVPNQQQNHFEPYRKLFWTVKNHGDYNLNETTLTSSTLDIDWVNGTITAPYGIRRDDSLMMQFDKAPGLAWHYDYVQTHEDSAYTAVRTGDTITIYACGNDLDVQEFRVIADEPTASSKVVMPLRVPNNRGWFGGPTDNGFCAVSDGAPGMDTISNAGMIGFGMGFGTRVDSLTKYLDVSPGATLSFVWVDGHVRTDLKNGDILRVTAEDASTKDYFIKINNYIPSHNADLGAITWPDIPETLFDLYGWNSDTIPSFTSQLTSYKLPVPADVIGIPALVAKAEDVNANIDITRAINLAGSPEDKTVTFTVSAQDDTTIKVYSVQLEKEKLEENIQPWAGEPFFSQYVFNEQWNGNTFLEVVNPGNQILDLSRYMFCWGYVNSPADAITRNATDTSWAFRYTKYIPGYKWDNEANWTANPAIAIQDAAISQYVMPGDVFAMCQLTAWGNSGYPWFASEACDIDFTSAHNPWGETIGAWGACLNDWWGENFYLFRIDNDSITLGTKPANDPNDFTLIDVWGSGDGSQPVVGGQAMGQIYGYVRKPNIYKGNTEFRGSFGTDVESSEWIMTNRTYYDNLGVGWPNDILFVAQGMGSHVMSDVSVYKSTVSSTVYKVSEGYSMDELIKGPVTGTNVTDFLDNIIKADPDQTLTLIRSANGDTLVADSVLVDGDELFVLSADTISTSKYVLQVTDEGLSSDAVLTSTQLAIDYFFQTGTVSGFAYGTKLKDVYDAVVIPDGATFNIIDDKDAYVPFKMLNFDTLYVDVQVSDKIFFEVIAENGTTKIVYQLKPTGTSSDAFVTSSVFDVDQEFKIIDYIPGGTTPLGLYANLIPAPGATMRLVDKLGYDRLFGNVVKDDILIVTSEDSTAQVNYLLQILGDQILYAFVQSQVYTVDQIEFVISSPSDRTTVAAFIANLVPAPGATFVIKDAEGVEVTTGKLMSDYTVEVTSGDGIKTVTYSIDLHISAAYVESAVYAVDQTLLVVSEVPEQTAVADFVANLTIPDGATLKVVDALGAEVTTGNVLADYKVEVTSSDGLFTVTYEIDILVSVDNPLGDKVVVFPNPSKGTFNVTGVKVGNRIQVTNIIGVRVYEKVAESEKETILLEGQRNGVYFISISNDKNEIGRYKVVKE
jgi:hypothetical protein